MSAVRHHWLNMRAISSSPPATIGSGSGQTLRCYGRTKKGAGMNYLDGNAAAGELTRIFAVDITSAEGQCANCGARKRFAEAHLYLQCPGLVARCPLCGHVL